MLIIGAGAVNGRLHIVVEPELKPPKGSPIPPKLTDLAIFGLGSSPGFRPEPSSLLLEFGQPQANLFAIGFLLHDLALVGAGRGIPGLRRSSMRPKDRDTRAGTLLDLDGWGAG